MSLVEVSHIVKSYGGLRPFRLEHLAVEAGEVVTIAGPDQQAAAVLTDILTGTTLPDTGSVLVAGHSTSELQGPDAWLAFLDHFGIVNERVVLLDQLSAAANLAVPLTLEIDPMPEAVRVRVERLAGDVGLGVRELEGPLAGASPMTRLRLRLGRAIAHDPRILIVEHPSVGLSGGAIEAAGELVRALGGSGGRCAIVTTADRRFASAAATRRLAWRAATGAVTEQRRWW